MQTGGHPHYNPLLMVMETMGVGLEIRGNIPNICSVLFHYVRPVSAWAANVYLAIYEYGA
jgi:hypothetical protein